MDRLRTSLRGIPTEKPPRPTAFTFIPVLQDLPIKGVITPKERPGGGNSPEEPTSDGQRLRARIVFISGAGDAIQRRGEAEGKRSLVSPSQTDASPTVGPRSENTPASAAAALTGSMETAVKHACSSQQRGPGAFASAADLFPTPSSSRESVLSDARLPSLASPVSPVSLSRAVSPCSSACSGLFSPALVQVKKHFLAPGSSLVHIPQTCFSSCDSLSSPASPPPAPRHRPPVTRLSLLTAILRKGRLPVLSPAPQRPYTPCWPVNPVTLSFCSACSAASSVASIPLEFSSRSSSSASPNVPGDPGRSVTAPPPAPVASECVRGVRSSAVPRRERVISPAPAKNTPLRSDPAPKPEERTDCDYRSPQPSQTHTNLKGHDHNNFKTRFIPSARAANEPQNLSRPLNSSLSKLRLLSQRLRSPPVCPPQLRPPRTDAPPCSPAFPGATGRCGSHGGGPAPQSVAPSPGFGAVHCLSPSRFAPMAFPGWPSPASSPTPTPSPAPPIRVLTPSPSPSLCTTPSPRPGSGISDCSDREGKKRKTHKIKSSYKSFAAIPTNTLLLDQQAIDEQVERAGSPGEALQRGATPDPHAEMRSPAQLRQESEELYAVIDEVLANSAPPPKQAFRSSTAVGPQRNTLTLPKSLGRETKYASICSLHPSAHVEKKKEPKMTRPGIIRPMTAVPKLMVDAGFHPKPLRPFVIKTLTGDRKVHNVGSEEAEKDFFVRSTGQTLSEERRSDRKAPFSSCDLYITEPEDQRGHLAKDASTSFSPKEWQMEAFEAHI
ncbi:proline-rich protein 36 [Betta splendens]|uniref:Proline-rich protein 36 n=1 Tax=Betta splendens TaxID=158456 RepID=A0A6P7PG26_BETSP|nr:proline-rich protein 36 [Betta splendens]